MKISHKLITILSTLSVFLLVISCFGWRAFKLEHVSMETIYKDRVIPLRDLNIIANAYAVSIIDLVNKTNAGLITAENATLDLGVAQQTIKEKWKSYTLTNLTKKEAILAKDADQLFVSADASIKNLIEFLQTKHGVIAGELTDFDGPLYLSIDPISNKVAELVNLQLDVVGDEFEKSTNQYRVISWVNITGITIAILASIASIWVGSAIISQLSYLGGEPIILASAIKDIANGNLSLLLDERDARDGSIAKEINKMCKQLMNVINGVNIVSNELNFNAQTLRESSTKSLNDLHNQQQQTKQVVAAMNEMSATISDVARNAQGAAKSSLAADKEVADGNMLVETSLQSIVSLTNAVGEAADVVNQLSNDSAEIGKIIEVIRSIAEQTNLLALNAAIEAARAGEQGRGFAVVADEVRTLASRTYSSTQEIQSMIKRLQSGVSNAVAVMEKSKNNSGETVEYAEKIQGILSSIKLSVSHINGMNIQIAAATEQQTMVADDIHKNVSNISLVTEFTVTSINLVENSSKELTSYAFDLQNKMSFFK